VIDRAQIPHLEPARQLVGVDPVRLVAPASLAPAVADNHPIRNGHEQIVQPLRLRAFLEGDVDGAPHAAEELRDRCGIGWQDRPRDHATGLRADRGHRRCLMDVQRHIFRRSLHEGRSLLRVIGLGQLDGSTRGRALNMRQMQSDPKRITT